MRACCAFMLVQLVMTGSLTAQRDAVIIERCVWLTSRGHLDSVRSILPELRAQYGSHAGIHYLDGMLENDARRSLAHFIEIVERHPLSSWADDALVRIYEYYRARGEDSISTTIVDRLRRDYPLSPYLTLTEHHLTAGGTDTAEYALQVGAFAVKENALRLRDTLALYGYGVEILENFLDGKRLLYLLWVGTYHNVHEAEVAAEQIRALTRIGGVVRPRSVLKSPG